MLIYRKTIFNHLLCKEETVMKSANVFLWAMYLHLLFCIGVPVGIFILCMEDGWNAAGVGLLLLYWLETVAVQIIGWVCAAMAVVAYRQEKWEELLKAWKQLKLKTIPFYVVNFLYSFLIWFILVGASRGIMILLVPVPIIYTCTMIVQSGCVGICYIKHLRRHREDGKKPSGIHYVWQLLAVFDIISTVVTLKTYVVEKKDAIDSANTVNDMQRR